MGNGAGHPGSDDRSQAVLKSGDVCANLFNGHEVKQHRQDFLFIGRGHHPVGRKISGGFMQHRNGFPALLDKAFPCVMLLLHHGKHLIHGDMNQPESASPFFTNPFLNDLVHVATYRLRDTDANGTGNPVCGQRKQQGGEGLSLPGGHDKAIVFEKIRGDGWRDEVKEGVRRLLGLIGHGVFGVPVCRQKRPWPA